MGKNKKRLAIVAAVSAIAIAGGAAWAAWTTDSVGSATATAASAKGFTITAASVDGPGLFPGATRDLKFTVVNNNDYPVIVTTVSLIDNPDATDSDGFSVEVNDADCQGTVEANGHNGKTGILLFNGTATTTTLTAPASGFPTAEVPNGYVIPANESKPIVVPNGVKMTNDSDNACQGKTFSLDLKVTTQSAAS